MLGAIAFHVQAALGPGTQAHSCVFRIGVEMDIKMMKVGCHMQPMRKFCQQAPPCTFNCLREFHFYDIEHCVEIVSLVSANNRDILLSE